MRNVLRSTSVPVMLCGNILAIGVSVYTFWPVPIGAHIRPMGWALFIVLLELVSFVAGACLAIFDVSKGRTLSAIFGLVLSLTPLPLALGLFKIFTISKGLKILE